MLWLVEPASVQRACSPQKPAAEFRYVAKLTDRRSPELVMRPGTRRARLRGGDWPRKNGLATQSAGEIVKRSPTPCRRTRSACAASSPPARPPHRAPPSARRCARGTSSSRRPGRIRGYGLRQARLALQPVNSCFSSKAEIIPRPPTSVLSAVSCPQSWIETTTLAPGTSSSASSGWASSR